MLIVYYRMYMTYTLTGFLFDIDQSNVCRDIQKIEPLVRQCLFANSAETLQNNKEIGNGRRGGTVFPRL